MDMKFQYLDAFDAAGIFSDKFEFVLNKPSYAFLQHRMAYLLEEYDELAAAIKAQDAAEILDGAMDVAFIAITQAYQLFRMRGSSHVQAVLKTRMAFLEVCRTNLEKNAPTKRGMKITKPEGWKPPRMEDLLRSHSNGFLTQEDMDRQDAMDAINVTPMEEANPDA